jgi:hypothetical protein
MLEVIMELKAEKMPPGMVEPTRCRENNPAAKGLDRETQIRMD